MNNHIENFERTVTAIISAFDQNRSINIMPSKSLRESLEEVRKLVRSETERKRKVAEKAGRRRKPDSELKNPAKALQMRRLRETWGANNKPPEAENEQLE